MKKIQSALIACLLTIALTACAAPFMPRTPEKAAQIVQPTTAPVTAVPETAQPATALPTAKLPAAVLPGQPAAITQIHMVDAVSGWGWISKTDGSYQLARTADAGATWKDASPQGKPINPYGGFFLDAQTAWVPFFDPASNTGSLLRTTDGGKTWQSLPPIESAENAGYTFTSVNDGVAQTAGVGAGQLYLNLYQTSDGGQSWAPILLSKSGNETGLPAGTLHLCNICGDNLFYDSARTVIAYGDLANEPTGAVRLAVSTDLGQRWKNIELPFPDIKYVDGLVGPKPMKFFGPQGVLPVNLIKYNADGTLGFSALILYSTQDGGQTWAAAPGILENNTSQYDSVQIITPSDAFVRCGRNLCSTRDGGQSWQTLPASLNFDSAQGGPDYVYTFSFVSPTAGWAISGESPNTILWKSTDGGASWTSLAPSLVP